MALEQLSREEILLIEGREEGRAEGRAEGREEERKKRILRMYQKGMSFSDIEEIMELSELERKKILNILDSNDFNKMQ